MVHLRETEVFKWKMPQPFDSVIRGEFAPTHLIEKVANRFGVQEE
jgi:hypothetical protein